MTKVSGTARLPVADMARQNLRSIFPNATEEQLAALRDGRPVPPSVGWQPPAEGMSPITIARLMEDIRQRCRDKSVNASVSCVLVFGDKRRLRMARTAVNQFLEQSYEDKELVIVNATDVDVINREHKFPLKEKKVEPASIAALRNRGVGYCTGAWIMPCWDDDDQREPWLLTYMMSFASKQLRPLALRSQIRVHLAQGTVYVHENYRGIPNTMLIPREQEEFKSFTEEPYEDQELWKHYADQAIVIGNTEMPYLASSIAVYHSYNLTPAQIFMSGRIGDDWKGKWEVLPACGQRVKQVMAARGLTTVPAEKLKTA